MRPITALSKLKNRLSHIDGNSRHFELVSDIWKKRAYNSKACTYYWVKLPSSLLVLAIAVVIGALIVVIASIGALLAMFFGFVPDFASTPRQKKNLPVDSRGKKKESYGYKMLPNGRHVRYAPWELAALGAALYFVYYTALVNDTVGVYLLVGIAALLVLGVFIYAISGKWSNPNILAARSSVKAAWDKVCPTLVIEHDRSSD